MFLLAKRNGSGVICTGVQDYLFETVGSRKKYTCAFDRA